MEGAHLVLEKVKNDLACKGLVIGTPLGILRERCLV